MNHMVNPRPGSCLEAEVIELSRPHPEGGYDPEDPPVSITPLAPGIDRIRTPRQPVRIGHATDVRDPEGAIYTNGAMIQPGDLTFIDAGCPDCDSQLVVLPNQEPGVTWLVIEHSPSCPALATWTRRAS